MNIINVNKYPISRMLDPDSRVVFKIPRYQREYVWGTREWATLYNDLSDNDEGGYFLGSIICINSATNTLLPKFEVVDGQQRLTTISLLLAALYDVLNSHRDDLDEDQQSDVLQLKRKLVLKKTIQNMRVIPQVPKHCRVGSIQLRQKICKIEKRPYQHLCWHGRRSFKACFTPSFLSLYQKRG